MFILHCGDKPQQILIHVVSEKFMPCDELRFNNPGFAENDIADSGWESDSWFQKIEYYFIFPEKCPI